MGEPILPWDSGFGASLPSLKGRVVRSSSSKLKSGSGPIGFIIGLRVFYRRLDNYYQ